MENRKLTEADRALAWERMNAILMQVAHGCVRVIQAADEIDDLGTNGLATLLKGIVVAVLPNAADVNASRMTEAALRQCADQLAFERDGQSKRVA